MITIHTYIYISLYRSTKTGNKILDNLLPSVASPVIRMREDIESVHQGKRRNSGILGRSGPAGFIIEADNVSLEVYVKDNIIFLPNIFILL